MAKSKIKKIIAAKVASIRVRDLQGFYDRRAKRLQREYGKFRKYLAEYNEYCPHHNLPSMIKSLSDYQLLAAYNRARTEFKIPREDFHHIYFGCREYLMRTIVKCKVPNGRYITNVTGLTTAECVRMLNCDEVENIKPVRYSGFNAPSPRVLKRMKNREKAEYRKTFRNCLK